MSPRPILNLSGCTRGPCDDMLVGETITWKGRLYVLRGVDPRGVKGRCADLKELATGEEIRVEFATLLRDVACEQEG